MTQHRIPARDSGRTLPGIEPEQITPPSGIDLEAVRKLGPAEAVMYLAEQIKAFRELLTRLEKVVDRAAVHSDRAERAAEGVRADLATMRPDVDALLEAVLVLQPLPARMHQLYELLIELQGSVAGILTRFPAVERNAASAAFTSSRSWQATAELRSEVAKLAGAVHQSLAEAKVERERRQQLERELEETRRVAQDAAEEAEEASDWAEKTGRRHLDDLQRRASRGDELLEAQAKAELKVRTERRRAVTRAVTLVVAGLVGSGGVAWMVLARACGG